ncbi:MAG: hypothetical protein AB1758_03025 [Candidatus Eremiobacterota bacterium]
MDGDPAYWNSLSDSELLEAAFDLVEELRRRRHLLRRPDASLCIQELARRFPTVRTRRLPKPPRNGTEG